MVGGVGLMSVRPITIRYLPLMTRYGAARLSAHFFNVLTRRNARVDGEFTVDRASPRSSIKDPAGHVYESITLRQYHYPGWDN